MQMSTDEQSIRVHILHCLQKRELYVPDAQKLPLEVLQNIYNRFVVPQPARKPKERTKAAAVVTGSTLKRSSNELTLDMEQLTKRIKLIHAHEDVDVPSAIGKRQCTAIAEQQITTMATD